jgi:hypothetical protein
MMEELQKKVDEKLHAHLEELTLQKGKQHVEVLMHALKGKAVLSKLAMMHCPNVVADLFIEYMSESSYLLGTYAKIDHLDVIGDADKFAEITKGVVDEFISANAKVPT